MRHLYKTTIVIWSEYDGAKVELSALAREAEQGEAYCSSYRSESVEDPSTDPAWDGTEFFGDGDERPPAVASGDRRGGRARDQRCS
jgi:hypothetical protein